MKRRRHYILALIEVPDRPAVLSRILPLLPTKSLVGIGRFWSPPDRARYDLGDSSCVDQSLERLSSSIKILLDKIDRTLSLDMILVIGASHLPVPDQALDLFSILDSALSQPSYHAAIRIICLQETDLNDWDDLLGATVQRLASLSEIGPGSIDDGNVVFRGNLLLTSADHVLRTVPGVKLVVHDRSRLADADRLFSNAHSNGSPASAQIRILSRVRIETVPVILFRRSLRGRLQWNASRDTAHRLLSYWASGSGIMSDGYGLFMEILGGGPILFVYAAQGQLHYRMVVSLDDESKMVAVKQAFSHSERYACPATSRIGLS